MMLDNGNYYLFTGTLTVEVKNPNGGGNGHWTICLQSNTMPVFGTGNNRPTSPCEPQKSVKGPGTDGTKPKPTGGDIKPTGGDTKPTRPANTPATTPTKPTTIPTRGGK